MNTKQLGTTLTILFAIASTTFAQSPVRVSVEKVKREDFFRTVDVPATIRSNEVVSMYSKVGGYLKNINVDIGDEVKEDDVLAQLEIPEMESQLAQKKSRVRQAEAEAAQANAAIKQADAQLAGYRAAIEEAQTHRAQKQAMLQYQQTELARLTQLANQGAIRRELVDSAQFKFQAAEAGLAAVDAQVRTAQANLVGAEANVEKARADALAAESKIEVAKADLRYVEQLADYATLRAPFDGQITKRMFDKGAFIQSAEGNSAAKPILTVSQMDKIRVTFAISMSDIDALHKGDRVILSRITALPDKTFEGSVSRFSAALDQETRMLRAEVDMDNKNGELNPGYFGYVKVLLTEFKNATVVPASALRGEGDNQHVFLAQGGKAVRHSVTVDFSDGKQAAVNNGLNGGESVIVSTGKLTDGQAIEVRKD